MSEKALSDLLESIKLMDGELRFLRQLVHLQHAEIQAVREYVIDIGPAQKDRGVAFQELSRLTREIYDKNIERLEAKHPALAASIDMRDRLDHDQQDAWYFPTENPPPNP
jgi:hypothetical protein